MDHKQQIDADAEREANALRKQGKDNRQLRRHIREQIDYNRELFDKLFEN